MTSYRVRWVIDIEAKNELEAAREALALMRERGSSAVVFEVGDGEYDLDDSEPCAYPGCAHETLDLGTHHEVESLTPAYQCTHCGKFFCAKHIACESETASICWACTSAMKRPFIVVPDITISDRFYAVRLVEVFDGYKTTSVIPLRVGAGASLRQLLVELESEWRSDARLVVNDDECHWEDDRGSYAIEQLVGVSPEEFDCLTRVLGWSVSEEGSRKS